MIMSDIFFINLDDMILSKPCRTLKVGKRKKKNFPQS